MSEFHAHDGWYFKRVDGWVHMTHRAGEETTEFVVFSPETWGSIVASVSSRGEDGASFAKAMNLHMGKRAADPQEGDK